MLVWEHGSEEGYTIMRFQMPQNSSPSQPKCVSFVYTYTRHTAYTQFNGCETLLNIYECYN